MFLYKITNKINNKFYIGITKKNINVRFSEHMSSALYKNTNNKFYNAIKKYGKENFEIELIGLYTNKEELEQAEKDLIEYYFTNNIFIYNTLRGEYHNRDIKNKEEWKSKLKIKRKGRTPSLGMKHSNENKTLFGEYGKIRWDIYGRYPKDVINYKFSEANKKFGISKTHYYRLLKQINEQKLTNSVE